MVQPIEVLSKKYKGLVRGPLDDLVDEIFRDITPKIVKAVGEQEIDEDVEEYLAGAQEGRFEAVRGWFADAEDNQSEDYYAGYDWGFANAKDWDGKDLPTAVKRKVVQEQIKEFKGEVTEQMMIAALESAWASVNPREIFKTVMRAVKQHGWKIGLVYAVGEIIENVVLPAALSILTGTPIPPGSFAWLPLNDIVFAAVVKRLGRNNEVDDYEEDGHLDWYEAQYGAVRLASVEAVASRYMIAGSCPVRSMAYGGLPSAGGFNAIKEFGVGLSNAFEAAHCVLGSLGRHLGKEQDQWEGMISVSKGHLLEEVGIIRKILKEYTRPIYRDQLSLDDLSRYKEEYRERVKENIHQQVEDILDAGPRLSALASKLGKQFTKSLEKEGYPPPWADLSAATYRFVEALADAAVKSVKDFPEVGDPFSAAPVKRAFGQMEKALKDLHAWKRAASRVAKRHAFVSNPIIYLKKYLTQEDWEKGAEVADDNEGHFMQWLEENPDLVEDVPALQQAIESGYIDDVWSLPPEVLKEYFGEVEHALSGESWSPSWLHMNYEKVMKNQWMIHFTDDAYGVACSGFKYGMDDLTRLGLTTHFNDSAKPGGYNFAYDLNDWERFAGGRWGFKYGKEAVLFKASGVKVWHHGDNEYQVIFAGNTAKDIVPLTEEGYYGGWWANGIGKGGREEHDSEQGDGSFDSLSQAVDWVVANFGQYKKFLTC